MNSDIRHLWPASLREIADNLSDQIALDLWLHFPGVAIYIPLSVEDDHRLVAALGREGANRICALYGREQLRIPRAYKARLVLRNCVIRQLRRDGHTNAALAIHYNLSERRVIDICTSALIDELPESFSSAMVPAMRHMQVDLFESD